MKHGPVILRLRTENRTDKTHVPSLTPVWRGAEFQEREIFDLYGIVFDGHPDLRRILMWDEFKDFPMRKDYVEPDDYEYEPTPHDDVLEKAKAALPGGGKGMSRQPNSALTPCLPAARKAAAEFHRHPKLLPAVMRRRICSKFRWGRSIPRRTACSAWMSFSTASAW